MPSPGNRGRGEETRWCKVARDGESFVDLTTASRLAYGGSCRRALTLAAAGFHAHDSVMLYSLGNQRCHDNGMVNGGGGEGEGPWSESVVAMRISLLLFSFPYGVEEGKLILGSGFRDAVLIDS